MSASSTRLTKTHKVSIAGIAAAAVAALTFSLVPGNASAETEGLSNAQTTAAHHNVVKQTAAEAHAKAVAHAKVVAHAKSEAHASAKAHAVAKANAAAKHKAHVVAKANAAAKHKAHVVAKANAAAKKKAAAKAAMKKRTKAQAANRSTARKPIYANNLDGWIRESLDIMKKHHIPGSYNGLHRNIMRESSGNPNAINNWDINAINGVPSIGLLQVIKPTFDTYHVPGTVHSQYDPVANITAAANYAADRYGSIDNVNSAY
ncbi:transglycosylase SLT domain-containing protein [Streptomyces sp. NBC_00829]|uniref:transglycosylase SLT domain-containing protein n=1 Tax=Streptomyces sp. NBC_00829 TaxID=2903679 RepID=UPI00386F26E9|nr:transglycosylase SLT domain-containing protein [Streptomyces sp. NBC_00829]